MAALLINNLHVAPVEGMLCFELQTMAGHGVIANNAHPKPSMTSWGLHGASGCGVVFVILREASIKPVFFLRGVPNICER